MLTKQLLLCAASFLSLVSSQVISESNGYTGYTLEVRDENDSVVYETENTDTSDGAVLSGPPDVYLNANVHVGEIGIEVDNITAKINIDAQVLNLLKFNAGVDLSINRVKLDIQNVTARLTLEARLGNLVRMINDTLDSIDLNPIIANLGNDVGDLLNGAAGAVGGIGVGNSGSNQTLTGRSQLPFDLANNILYSTNSYTQDMHTNYMLSQSGDIIAQSLHNDGTVYAKKTVGTYWHDMSPTGHEHSVLLDGQMVVMREYLYEPFPGLMIISAIYADASGTVVKAQVISESGGGGSSTIADD